MRPSELTKNQAEAVDYIVSQLKKEPLSFSESLQLCLAFVCNLSNGNIPLDETALSLAKVIVSNMKRDKQLADLVEAIQSSFGEVTT